MRIIDPHVHFFLLDKGKYAWLKPQNPPFWPDKAQINRSFSVADLILSPPLVLEGLVHIEAGFDNEKPWREMACIEQICPLPLKTIASVCLTHVPNNFRSHLERLKQCRTFVGVRHILDNAFFEALACEKTKKNIHDNVKQLSDAKCIFEAQCDVNNTEHVNAFITLIKGFPRLRIALNHAGFAPSTPCAQWKTNIKALAQLPTLHVKASGWEMSDRHYSPYLIEKQVKHLIDVFGDDRVMLASNFPLTLFRTSFDALWQSYFQMTLPSDTLEKLAYHNAKRFYSL